MRAQNGQPLYLPVGSVRAIMALMFTIVTCALAIGGSIDGNTFLTVEGVILAFYFGTKSK